MTFRSRDISTCIVAKVTKVKIPKQSERQSFKILNDFSFNLKITINKYKDNRQGQILGPGI